MDNAVQMRLLLSLLIILIFWLLRNLTLRAVCRRTEDPGLRYTWQKTTFYVIVSFSILFLGVVWFESFRGLPTFMGLLTAGLAIALKDLVANVVGWLFIIWRRPFTAGDRIQIGEYRGDVVDIRVFQFTLMEIGNWVDSDQSTGRVIHNPNGMILSHMLSNYSAGFAHIWNEIPVLLTFESDWRKAKGILQHIASTHAEHLSKAAEKKIIEASRKLNIRYTKLSPTVYTSVRESGVLLTVRYLCKPRERRSTEDKIWEDILKGFAECSDMDFAYPTQRFYDHRIEGMGRPATEKGTNP